MTKANRKKIAKELLRAAERIELGEELFCGPSIQFYKARNYFNNIFMPDAKSLETHMPISWLQEYNENEVHDEIRSRRVLAICWAALMAEEGVF